MRQISFSRLWDGYATDKEALAARNAEAKKRRAMGHKVFCTTLRNQIKRDAYDQDEGICNVYMLTDADEDNYENPPHILPYLSFK